MHKFVKGIVGLKKNCVNANKPEKRTKAKNAAKQGNAGERPDAAARYTVKSSRVNSLLFYFTGIFQRINSGSLRAEPSMVVMLQIYPQNKS